MGLFKRNSNIQPVELTSDQQKLRSFVVIGILTVSVGVVAGVLYWLFFAHRHYTSAKLAPIDTQLYTKLEWRETSDQNINLNNLSLSLGGTTTIDDLLKLMIPTKFANTDTSFNADIAPWISDDVAIIRRNIANKDEEIKVFIANDKDKEQLFLDKITREADAVAKESYKGYQIQTIVGVAPVSFVQVGDAVAFASKPKVLHDILDVAAGDTKSLSKAEDFQVAERHSEKSALVTSFVDISTFFKNPTQFGLPADIAVALTGPARLNLSVTAKERGFGLQVFVPKVKNSSPQNNFTEDILSVTPNNIAGYLGATNLSGLLSQYLTTVLSTAKFSDKKITQQSIESQYGVNFESDLLQWLKGPYALVSVAENSNQFALIIKVDDKDKTAASLKKVEKAISGIAKELSAEPEKIPAEFGESGSVRYLPVGGANNYSLNYAFKDNFLVLATSRDALDKILTPAKDQPSLLNSKQYELVNESLPKGNASGILYLQGTMVIGFLQSIGYNFDQFDRHIVGLGMKSENIEDGKLITGFLPIL